MRKFLFLKIVASIVLVVLTSMLLMSLYNLVKYYSSFQWWFFPLNVLFISSFSLHSFAVLHLCGRYYPDKDLPKGFVLFYRLAALLGLACAGFFTFAVFADAFQPDLSGVRQFPDIRRREILTGLILAILIPIQLIGGRQLSRTIQRNAQKKLEDSFA